MDDLDNPKDFTLAPPIDLLRQNKVDLPQLRQAMAYAEKVLLTSKVRPSVWVAWRDFSREAKTFLQKQNEAQISPVAQPARPISLRKYKNVFVYFVLVARDFLPKATFVAIEEQALAKLPRAAFPRQFRAIAQEVLTPEVFARIDLEACRRDALELFPAKIGLAPQPLQAPTTTPRPNG